MDSIGTEGLRRTGALLIAGPTASGKSALALRLADACGGVVINADSMAVYRDLTILTGRPSAADCGRAPHELYGHVDGAESYSVGRWCIEAAAALEAAWAASRVPIVTGGTGLYFKALTQGLSEIPAVPEDLRARLRAEASHLPPAELHARLAARDPETAARLRPSDPQRILRALEVHEATGQPLATFQRRRGTPVLRPGRFLGVALSPDRAVLRGAIDGRFDAMMAAGALDEVRRLAARHLDPALPVCRALGVPQLLAHLGQGVDLAVAVAAAKAETRAYARRQMTFLRHQLPDFTPLAPDAAAAALAARLGLGGEPEPASGT